MMMSLSEETGLAMLIFALLAEEFLLWGDLSSLGESVEDSFFLDELFYRCLRENLS